MRCNNPECGENTIIGEVSENGTVVRRCVKCATPWREQATSAAIIAPVTKNASPYIAAKDPRQNQAANAEPINVIQAARARLRELNTELARMKKLTRERDQLVRLLAAAKTPNGAKAAIPLRRCAT